MRIKSFATKGMETNCYVISCEETKEAIVIDIGDKIPELLSYIKSEDLKIKAVVLTHGHYDHIAGIPWFKENISAPVICGKDEAPVLESPNLNLSPYFSPTPLSLKADRLLSENEEYTFGKLTFKTLFTPGHTQGGVCLYFKDQNVLISGDSLFAMSIGRTDFPGGSYQTLIESIKEKILPLPDETIVFPGHGPKTTVSAEKKLNPYL